MEKFYYYIFDRAPGGGQVSLTLCQPPRYLRSNIFHSYSWKSSTTTYLTGRQAEGRSALPCVSRPAICVVIYSIAIHGKVLLLHIWQATKHEVCFCSGFKSVENYKDDSSSEFHLKNYRFLFRLEQKNFSKCFIFSREPVRYEVKK